LSKLLLETQNPKGVLETCQRLLAVDPCLEAAHRFAMRAYATLGDRAAVVRQFESCQTSLFTEINIPPSEETRQLFEILIH
jgi:LuxR family maltose regulon positive regulatory protein